MPIPIPFDNNINILQRKKLPNGIGPQSPIPFDNFPFYFVKEANYQMVSGSELRYRLICRYRLIPGSPKMSIFFGKEHDFEMSFLYIDAPRTIWYSINLLSCIISLYIFIYLCTIYYILYTIYYV